MARARPASKTHSPDKFTESERWGGSILLYQNQFNTRFSQEWIF
jgi:hypothetical protein